MVDRLIIHAGLHKTGTTAFQLLCQRDSLGLLENGIYVVCSEFPEVACPFEIAFDFQVGDFRRIAKVIEDANAARCGTVLISAEDFSFCLSDPALSARLETFVAALGVRQVIWAFGLRRTSDYFWSLHAETAKHGIFAQSLTWFDHAMRAGYLVEPIGEFLGYSGRTWFFPVDQIRILSEFAGQVSGEVMPFSYDEAPLMPGLQILADYCLTPPAFAAFLERNAPYFAARLNARFDDATTTNLAVVAFLSRLPAEVAERQNLAAELASGYLPSDAARLSISRALDERFGDVRSICKPPTYKVPPDLVPLALARSNAQAGQGIRGVLSALAAKFDRRT